MRGRKGKPAEACTRIEKMREKEMLRNVDVEVDFLEKGEKKTDKEVYSLM